MTVSYAVTPHFIPILSRLSKLNPNSTLLR